MSACPSDMTQLACWALIAPRNTCFQIYTYMCVLNWRFLFLNFIKYCVWFLVLKPCIYLFLVVLLPTTARSIQWIKLYISNILHVICVISALTSALKNYHTLWNLIFFQKIIMLRTQFLSTICLLLWGKGLVTPFPHSFLFSVTFLTVNIFWEIPSIDWCEKRQTFIPIWEYKHMPLMSPFYFLTWQIFSGNCLLTHMHKISQP